ncbi:MAG: rhomboid family intramembrane serine protease [Erysipelotrichaceae bacterium]
MSFAPHDLYILQVVHVLIQQYQYRIVNVSQSNHNIYLSNPNVKDFPLIKVTKARIEDYTQDHDYQEKMQEVIKRLTKSEGSLLVVSVNEATIDQKGEDFEVVHLVLDAPFYHPNPMVGDLSTVLRASNNLEADIRDMDSKIIEASKRNDRKSRMQWKNLPHMTMAIIGICVVYFLLITGLTAVSQDQITSGIFLGAYYKMSIISMHEYWRFFTAGFMHLDFLHLLINMMALFQLGRVIEQMYRKSEYATILIGSILCGSLFVFIADANVVSVGISGGIYGMLAAFIVYIFATGGHKNPLIRANLIQIILINLLISLMPGISLMGHLGGFIFGLFAGFFFTKKPAWKPMRIHVAIAGLLLAGSLIFIATTIERVDPIYGGTDSKLIEMARSFGLDGYADRMQENFNQKYGELQ